MDRGEELDALIERAKEGDVRAFEELIAGQLPRVRRFARAFAASGPDADDLAQDALLKAYKSLRLYRYQSAFATWLYTVVRSSFLDAAKSRVARQRSLEDPIEARAALSPAPDPLPDERLAQEQARQRVWEALRRIPVEFRTAIVLFDIEGRTYDEVAAIEAVPVGTVKSRLSRGRSHLKRALEEDDAQTSESVESGTSPLPTSSHFKRSGS
jgi:RNA polymerase sigma-70 factor (ECF subfamily)